MLKIIIVSLILGFALGLQTFEKELTLRDLDLAEDKNVMFKQWMAKFDKKYADHVVEAVKFMTWLNNLYKIAAHNTKFQNGESTYKLRLNQFSDMNSHEFKLYVHGTTGSCLSQKPRAVVLNEVEQLFQKETVTADSVDWTTKGVVTPVKNQKQCGSCWAFSTTGSIECRAAIAGQGLVALSEQQLMDCSRAEGNRGCQGGLMDNAFKYVSKNGGLCTEKEYPYTARNHFGCKSSQCSKQYGKIKGYVDVKADSASAMETAVSAGCVSIAIEADQTAFQSYSSGVMKGHCGTSLDHGVLLVGYGSEGSEKYWKVKNSWGESWGEGGYIRMCKECGKNFGKGECGLLMQGSFPTF